MTGPTALTRRLAVILALVTIGFFAAMSWYGERQSCLRQQLPRQAGNARKKAIDRLVVAVGPNLTAHDRADVVRLTKAVPTVPPLQCGGLLPATEP